MGHTPVTAESSTRAPHHFDASCLPASLLLLLQEEEEPEDEDIDEDEEEAPKKRKRADSDEGGCRPGVRGAQSAAFLVHARVPAERTPGVAAWQACAACA